MKLFISFLIALAIFLLVTLIMNVLKKLAKRFGDTVVVEGVCDCCIIALLTLLIYLLMTMR